MKVSPHFDLREFVPESIWKQYGEKSLWFLDRAIIDDMERLRWMFNAPIIINNWHTGGKFQNRGFRPPNSTVGARLSQHKFGRAIDFNVEGMSSDDVYDFLIDRWDDVSHFTKWTTLEDKRIATTWTHIDSRWVEDNSRPFIVKP